MDYLFVYGTLKSDQRDGGGADARQRLRQESEMVGVGRVEGRLFDIGWYPGLVLQRDDAPVFGELLRLKDSSATFAWLDPYEGVSLPAKHDDEYARVVSPVTGVDGSLREAWVYVYLLPVGELMSVQSGCWQGPLPD